MQHGRSRRNYSDKYQRIPFQKLFSAGPFHQFLLCHLSNGVKVNKCSNYNTSVKKLVRLELKVDENLDLSKLGSIALESQ